jgi:hypothetical protein
VKEKKAVHQRNKSLLAGIAIKKNYIGKKKEKRLYTHTPYASPFLEKKPVSWYCNKNKTC